MAEFGSDISFTFDIDPRCATVTGRRLLAEAIYRRLITPRGRLIDDPDYGTDITDLINSDVSPRDVAALASAIRAECMKDERVIAADVGIVVPPRGTGTYSITISLTAGDGPFDLVLSASEVSVDLLKVES